MEVSFTDRPWRFAMKDFAFTPFIPADAPECALTDAAVRLAKYGYAILYHIPSKLWIMHLPRAEDYRVVGDKLGTIVRNIGVEFRDRTLLDRFHGEVLGLFEIVQPAPLETRGLDEASTAEEQSWCDDDAFADEVIEESTSQSSQAPLQLLGEEVAKMFSSHLSMLNLAARQQTIDIIRRGYDHWNDTEMQVLPMLSAPVRSAFANILAKTNVLPDWLVLNGPVGALTFYKKPKMSLRRKLDWVLFRMERAGTTPIKNITHYIAFLTQYLAISPETHRTHSCQTCRELWKLWTGQPFPPVLPADVAVIERELRNGRIAAQCVVCLLPMRARPDQRKTCSDHCAKYCCNKHQCALEMLPRHCWYGDVVDAQLIQNLNLNLLRLRDLKILLAGQIEFKQLYAAESAAARAEMIRDGCCAWGLCALHAAVKYRLDELQMCHVNGQGFDAVRGSTLDAEIERLTLMQRPINRTPRFECSQCKAEAVNSKTFEAKAEVTPRPDLAKFDAWCKRSPELGTSKEPFEAWDAEADRSAKRLRWSRLTHEEREQRWSPIPGLFMPLPR